MEHAQLERLRRRGYWVRFSVAGDRIHAPELLTSYRPEQLVVDERHELDAGAVLALRCPKDGRRGWILSDGNDETVARTVNGATLPISLLEDNHAQPYESSPHQPAANQGVLVAQRRVPGLSHSDGRAARRGDGGHRLLRRVHRPLPEHHRVG